MLLHGCTPPHTDSTCLCTCPAPCTCVCRGGIATLSPPAQDVSLGQEMLPPSPEHLAVALCVSLCWMSPCAFVCGHNTALLDGAFLNPGSQKEPVDLKNIQGQTDGWELPGELHQSGVAAPSTAKGYQHSIFTLHIPSVMPANDSHWYRGVGGCHEKEGKKKPVCGHEGNQNHVMGGVGG